MNCPSCGEEVEAPATECAECGEPLADASPGPPPDPAIRLTPVLRTGDAALVALAKSLLEGEEIEYLVRSEGVQDLFGAGRIGTGFSIIAGPVEFAVRDEDADRARALLADLSTAVHSNDPPQSDGS
jgi:hypothetical protein